MSEQWLSIVEYARKNCLSDMTVRRRIKTGKLHAELREGKYYINSETRESADIEQADTPAATPSQSQLKPESGPEHPASRHFQLQAREVITPKGREERHLQTAESAHHGLFSEDSAKKVVFQLRELSQVVERALQELTDYKKSLEKSSSLLKLSMEERAAKIEQRLENRELKIESLEQQTEDLKTLIKIMEKAQPSQSKELSP